MSFQRRNVAIRGTIAARTPQQGSDEPQDTLEQSGKPTTRLPGVRPSPVDGRPTTSTGCSSLDGLLAGHGGLALGNSVLIEETGTTDYAGTLLRYYAAEGVVQGHQVHVVGVPEQWGRELPAPVSSTGKDDRKGSMAQDSEKMKIAWRYERLATRDQANAPTKEADQVFCHSFDLTKRLEVHPAQAIIFIPIRSGPASDSPFIAVIESLRHTLNSSPNTTIHRVVIPSLLSPAFYMPSASAPQQVLQFLHSLRALTRQFSTQLTAIISLPLTICPRSTGLARWMELLSDGVIELAPFPHSFDAGPSLNTSGAATAQEERPQGIVKVHRLPVFHERGGGGIVAVGVDDDLAFTVSRRKFVIKPFSLPPVDGDTEAQRGEAEGGKPSKPDLDF